jgi:hypothetical protein
MQFESLCQSNKKWTDSTTGVFRDCARKTNRLRRETRMISHRNFLMHGGNSEDRRAVGWEFKFLLLGFEYSISSPSICKE